MSKASPNIIVKNYQHFNRSMGVHITSKKQYKNEMARRGFVSFSEGQQLVKKASESKEYKPSKKALEIINSVKNSERKGKVKLNDRAIDGMKSLGMSFDIPKDVTDGL